MINLMHSTEGKMSSSGNPPGWGIYVDTELVVKVTLDYMGFSPYLLSFLYQRRHFSSLPSELTILVQSHHPISVYVVSSQLWIL